MARLRANKTCSNRRNRSVKVDDIANDDNEIIRLILFTSKVNPLSSLGKVKNCTSSAMAALGYFLNNLLVGIYRRKIHISLSDWEIPGKCFLTPKFYSRNSQVYELCGTNAHLAIWYLNERSTKISQLTVLLYSLVIEDQTIINHIH
jgi:hypothetical protein